MTDEESRVLRYVNAHESMYGSPADLDSIAACAKVDGLHLEQVLGHLERRGMVRWVETEFFSGYVPGEPPPSIPVERLRQFRQRWDV